MCKDNHGKEDGSTGVEQSDSDPQEGSSRDGNPDCACQSPLAALLLVRKSERGLRVRDLAELIGIRQPYMSQLMSGERQFSALSFDSLRAISVFLGVPAVRVFLMADVIRQEDLYPPGDEVEQLLNAAIRRVAESASAQEASVGLPELQALSRPVQFLLMFLHQEAFRTSSGASRPDRWKSFVRSSTFSFRTNRLK